jgi:multidrug efflux pump subunit AcrA (membrane-fusion protein)
MNKLVDRNSASSLELDQTYSAPVQSRSQIEITAAAIDQAKQNLQRTNIKAPFDGRVASRVLGTGQLVSSGTPLGDVFAVDYAQLRLPIASREAAGRTAVKLGFKGFQVSPEMCYLCPRTKQQAKRSSGNCMVRC